MLENVGWDVLAWALKDDIIFMILSSSRRTKYTWNFWSFFFFVFFWELLVLNVYVLICKLEFLIVTSPYNAVGDFICSLSWPV